jgi:hypothetical protein
VQQVPARRYAGLVPVRQYEGLVLVRQYAARVRHALPQLVHLDSFSDPAPRHSSQAPAKSTQALLHCEEGVIASR